MSTNKEYQRSTTGNGEFTQQFFIMDSIPGFNEPGRATAYTNGQNRNFNRRENLGGGFRGGRKGPGRRGRRGGHNRSKKGSNAFNGDRRVDSEILSTEGSDSSNSDKKFTYKRPMNFRVKVQGEVVLDQIKYECRNKGMFAEAKNMKPPEPHKLAPPMLS